MSPCDVVHGQNGHEAHLVEHAQDEILQFNINTNAWTMNIIYKSVYISCIVDSSGYGFSMQHPILSDLRNGGTAGRYHDIFTLQPSTSVSLTRFSIENNMKNLDVQWNRENGWWVKTEEL